MIKRILAGLLLLLGGWLYTETGLRLTVWLLNIPCASIHGRLAQHITVTGLQYETTDFKLNLQAGELRWNPWYLLLGQCEVQDLRLQGLNLDIKSEDDTTTNGYSGFQLRVAHYQIIDLTVQGLEPGPLTLSAQGSFQLSRQAWEIRIQDLQGQWAQQTLVGHAHWQQQGQTLMTLAADLHWGKNQLSINSTQAGWEVSLDLNQLGLFQPQASGSLQTKISLNQSPHGKLKAKFVSMAHKLHWNRVRLPQGDLGGEFTWEDGEIKGQIHQARLEDSSLDTWVLRQPIQFRYTQGIWSISHMDWYALRSSAYAKAQLYLPPKGDWRIQIELHKLPLTMLKPWLPEDIELISQLSVQLDANSRYIKGVVTISEGHLVHHTDSETVALYRFKGGDLQLDMQGSDLVAKTQFQFDADTKLKGELTLPQFHYQRGYKQKIRGQIQFQGNNLQWIEKWLPHISQLKGQIQAKWHLSGDLKQLQYQGEFLAQDISFHIPRLATQVTLSTLKIQQDQDKLSLNGHGTIGRGQFRLAGKMPSWQRWTEHDLHITGQDLLVANSPQLYLLASPDLHLNWQKEALFVRGRIHIPEAHVVLAEQAQINSETQDVVFTDTRRTRQKTTRLQIRPDIFLQLANNIHIQGYGLDAIAGGKLQLNEQRDGLFFGSGRLTLKEGIFRLNGNPLHIYHGRLLYTPGTHLTNPSLDIRLVQRDWGNLSNLSSTPEVGLYVQGTLQNPNIHPFAATALSDAEIFSRLGFTNYWSLILGNTGASLIEQLQNKFGLQEFNINTQGTTKGLSRQPERDATLVIGKSLGERLYLQYLHNLLDGNATVRLKYRLSEHWNYAVEANLQGYGTDLSYTIEKD